MTDTAIDRTLGTDATNPSTPNAPADADALAIPNALANPDGARADPLNAAGVREDVPAVKSVRARGSWQGSFATQLQVRGFELRTDEPVAAGGNDTAPTPMEFVAAALNGCITVVIETVAAELGVPLASVETSSAAHMDVRGFRGTADVTPHFLDYALTVQVVSPATPEQRDALQRYTERRCPALNLVRDAGVPLTIAWEWDCATAAASETAGQ
ncbi:OsmC family protein [Humibacter albus]|uniref:OsmC family protein n=1 Tax=Humibacter albus TaxID=427754 RepID=UPI0003B4BF74|nr:OsmC family protein [Humibacter albus]